MPPQNSTLVERHLGFSVSERISSMLNSRVTHRTGFGYVSPKLESRLLASRNIATSNTTYTARNPGIFLAVSRSTSFEYTLTPFLTHSLEMSSIFCISGMLIPDLWVKSNRSFVGATREPF